MRYPGYYIKTTTKNARIIKSVQRRLNTLGCGPLPVNGRFGKATRSAVKLFQARATDLEGAPLEADGIIGPLTWGALYGGETRITEKISPLVASMLDIAEQEVGVLEAPPGSNRGPRVDQYIKSVGLNPSGNPKGFAWCAAFVYWCFQRAAQRMGVANPAMKSAGVIDHWNKAVKKGINCISPSEIEKDIALLKPGLIFVIKTEGWRGHMGLVSDFQEGKLVTIEGNTSVNGNPEGIGVFRRHGRKLGDINKGYIEYE
jgi:hypothetical protein